MKGEAGNNNNTININYYYIYLPDTEQILHTKQFTVAQRCYITCATTHSSLVVGLEFDRNGVAGEFEFQCK